MKVSLTELLRMLLVKLYWAACLVWVFILLLGMMTGDGRLTIDMIEKISPIMVTIIIVGIIHWVIIYRKEKKRDSSN